MTQVILKLIDKPYDDCNAIQDLIKYVFKLHFKKPYDYYCYGFDTCKPYANFPVNTLPKDFNELYNLLSYSPGYPYKESPLSPNIAHIVVSFTSDKLSQNDAYFVNNIAYCLGQNFRVCYGFHKQANNPHAHILISTRNLVNPNLPLSEYLLNNHYYPIFMQLANDYNYNISFYKGR